MQVATSLVTEGVVCVDVEEGIAVGSGAVSVSWAAVAAAGCCTAAGFGVGDGTRCRGGVGGVTFSRGGVGGVTFIFGAILGRTLRRDWAGFFTRPIDDRVVPCNRCTYHDE